jgi:heat shock protein HslJ
MKSKSGAATTLEGTWTLNYISGPRIAFNGLYPKEKPRLVFTSASATEVNGHTSCNPFSAPLKINGNNINFGTVRSTMMACEGDGEGVFTRTLNKINRYNVGDSTLTLIIGDIAMMRFNRTK